MNIRIKIIGVGGAGSNAVARLNTAGLGHIPTAVVNTDAQALETCTVDQKYLIGRALTYGLGTGGDPAKGRDCAHAEAALLKELVDEVDLLFLVGGLGGGTGSGAMPAIAQMASKGSAIVIAFAAMPFAMEGGKRRQVAEDALSELRRHCHAAIALPNDLLLQQVGQEATVLEAFKQSDQWIGRGIGAITAMLLKPGLMNLDLANVRQALSITGGRALFGFGFGTGQDAPQAALNNLMLCPLLQTPDLRSHTDGLLVNILGGPELSIHAVNEMLAFITEKFGGRENVAVGAVVDERYREKVGVCVLGVTDIGKGAHHAPNQKFITKPQKDDDSQDEFTFVSKGQLRGYFDKTERNYFEGEDLDVPTYLRKGIKINF
tara:strand:+ start:64698 stop:65825 length:1128 start_codon:yes stop_codon:yes gene_type:complete